MNWLRAWSFWRVTLVAGGWFLVSLVGFFLLVRAEIARIRQSMPPDRDFLTTVDTPSLSLVAWVALGPPLLLVVGWLWARFRPA